jgi:hypothetical protein
MATGRTFAGKKLPLTIAFTVLLVAAFGAGCKGFFIPNALQSVAVQPASTSINVNGTQGFSLWGTYQDGTRAQITDGVVWTTSDSTIASLNGATATGVAPGTATITGSAQGLSGTSTVTVIGNVTSIVGSPSNQPVHAGGNSIAFTFAATPGPPNYITAGNGGTLTITTADAYFACTAGTDGSGNPAEVCTLSQGGTATSYQLQMSYPTANGGTVTSNIVTATVQ